MSTFENALYDYFVSGVDIRDIDQLEFQLVATSGGALTSETYSKGVTSSSLERIGLKVEWLQASDTINFGQLNTDFDTLRVFDYTGGSRGRRLMTFTFPEERPNQETVEMDTCEFTFDTVAAWYLFTESPDNDTTSTVVVQTEILSGGASTGQHTDDTGGSGGQEFDVNTSDIEGNNISVQNNSGSTIDPADGSLTEVRGGQLSGASGTENLSSGGLNGNSFTWPDGSTINIDSITITWSL
jgi:hypothetical protein